MGMGLQQTKSKWIPNAYVTKHFSLSPNLYSTASTFNNLNINVTFEREGRTCKLVFPSSG
jgi:hypothetical protein